MAEGYIANISGLDRLTDALNDLATSVSEPGRLRKVMEEMGMVLRRRTMQSFSQETAPEMVPNIGQAARAAGRAWKPLAESTKAGRRKGGGGAKALQDTAAMKRTVVAQVSSDGKEVTVGTSSPYAAYHAGGTGPYVITPKTAKVLRFIGAGGEVIFAHRVEHPGLTARPFIGVNEKDIDTMLNQVKRYLGEAMG